MPHKMFQSRVPTIDDEIKDENDIRSILPKLLNWQQDGPKITITSLSGGITNTLYKVSTRHETVVLRIFGGQSAISKSDRKRETTIFEQLGYAGIAPLLCGVFGNGRVEQYLQQARCLHLEDMTTMLIGNAVAVRLARLHAFRPYGDGVENAVPAIWSMMRQWGRKSNALNSDGRFTKVGIDVQRYENHIQEVQEVIEAGDDEIVFAHNDLQMGNIMKQEDTNDCMIIDYEYGNYNYQGFDIGDYFAEAMGGTLDGELHLDLYPCERFRRMFCKEYLKEFCAELPSEERVETMVDRAEVFSVVSHLFWGLWSLIQSDSSQIDFPYVWYAKQRLGVFDQHFHKHFQRNM